MAISCKMRGSDGKIAFLCADLAEFCHTLYNVYRCKIFMKRHRHRLCRAEQCFLWRFLSVQFLFVFLPLSLAVYWLCPKWLRNAVLAAFSLLFLCGRA